MAALLISTFLKDPQGDLKPNLIISLLISDFIILLYSFSIFLQRCPRNWVRYRESCYKFTRSPIKRWDDARLQCQAYRHQDSDHSDLASIGNLEEHRFITNHLNSIDPQHR